jgi:hypothetical protein
MSHHFTRRQFVGAAALALPVISARQVLAQDALESLGTMIGKPTPGAHPLETLMKAHPAALRAELRGVHPRVFTTATGLDELRLRAKGSHR